MTLKVWQFSAIILTALALVPGGAHLFALPNKIDLAQEAYFTVQGIYRGWALFGFVLMGGLIANLGLAITVRHRPWPFWLATGAFVMLAATLAAFFAWTYPANQLTDNWMSVPDNWERLRTQWEYSHAVNAVFTFVALCLVTMSVIVEGD